MAEKGGKSLPSGSASFAVGVYWWFFIFALEGQL
jgi:hypothetical protein